MPRPDHAPPLGEQAGFERALSLIRAGSPFLTDLVERDPARLARFRAGSPEKLATAIIEAQRSVADASLGPEGGLEQLRANRAAHALLVGLADLSGVWGLEQVVASLSDFADASVRAALAIAFRDAAARGEIDPGAVGPDGEGCGLTVLALGKLGGRELNYSSDIDLVAFYDPKAPALTDRDRAGRVYARVVQDFGRILSARTPAGYVHRVDFRLRPDPGSTPVAVSLPSAFRYYESVGQNWERAALIKARPIAGDLALGDRFLLDLAAFVWRRYFDFAAIADIHAMKRQIHAVRGFDAIAVAGHDLKLGRGGIREIEFFAQCQQLVFGGRRPALRGRSTLPVLRELAAEGWITGEAQDELATAYRLLRTLEHRLQMVDDTQTQRVPEHGPELERFARFSGYPDRDAFGTALTGAARRVQHHYGLLFRDASELALPQGDLVFTGTEADPSTLETLGRIGFRDPPAAAETVRGWHFGRRQAITSARAREVLTELTPALLEALGRSADPDGGLAQLDRAFGRMPAAVELLSILREHGRLRDVYADLLGSAPALADEVAASPHLLDALLDPDTLPDGRDAAAVIGAATADAPDTEAFLDRLRDAARQVRFSTGAHLLSGALSPARAGAAYAALADASIAAALRWSEAALAAEHGRVPGGAAAVLGLGRLGDRDLTASSDLDLVVLYQEGDPDAAGSREGGRLEPSRWYGRLAQRMVAALTVPTRRGRLYAVDMRLRPSGRQGPVATRFSAFRVYQETEAETWERMALCRARVVAGDERLGREVTRAIREILSRLREPAAVFADVRAMRDLMERELGGDDRADLKLAPGGLVDIDFVAQALTLAHAADHPELVGLPTPACLAEAGRLGLLTAGDAGELGRAHRILDDAIHWQRLLGHGSDRVGSTASLARVAQALGAPDAAHADARLDEVRREVRAIFRRVLG